MSEAICRDIGRVTYRERPKLLGYADTSANSVQDSSYRGQEKSMRRFTFDSVMPLCFDPTELRLGHTHRARL